MRKIDLLITVFAGVFGVAVELTPIQIKFIIIGAVSPVIALYMNRKDYYAEKPSFSDYVTTILLSLTFVWLGYEASLFWQIPTIISLIFSFFLGIFSLAIAIEIKKNLVSNIGSLIKNIFNKIDKWIQNL